ncbi:MAG: ATP-dependent DNA helicase RecG, partial [Candidatus Nanopelagicales bacterium]|nr:ATP-dependent DNA helicase RecG [Candidatus Nanopelagicales bacterium]
TAAFAGGLIPIYPATASLSSWRIAKALGVVLDQIDWGRVPDPLGAAVRTREDLPALAETFNWLHRPRDFDEYERARRRLRWDEALAVQLVLAGRRELLRHKAAVGRPGRDDGLVAALDRRLPFELTTGQHQVGEVISDELARGTPMQRLIQGDVGSGKTLVALRAMLQVLDAGGQAALLAPTEVLAGQHLRALRGLLGPLADRGLLGGHDTGTRLALLTGSMPASRRRSVLVEVAAGDAGIVIGTHALLQEDVVFGDLGLVVVDEQHRFGVQQRAALTERSAHGSRPHLLVMTATPIPRTVAMTVFGELEVSTLTDSPAGRAGVVSHAIEVSRQPRHRERAWEKIREEVAQGRQAYVVCPRISPGEDGTEDRLSRGAIPQNVVELADFLAKGPLVGIRLAQLHGQLPADEKEQIMRRFADGPASPEAIDVLVCTTVIEVGVDVANATVMVIIGADRFGVSQLHQMRGRVGRGAHPGLCLMISDADSDSRSLARVQAVAGETDGFRLAELDLGDRGEGDALGAEQSGRRSSLRMLSLLRDEKIIVAAREVADDLVQGDPHLDRHPDLAAELHRLLPEEAEDWLGRA